VPPEVVQHTLVLEYNNVAQLEEAFAAHGADLACLIIEPIAGNMNFVRASVPFMKRCRELCTQHGALLVFDEVMTGFRVGLGSAQGHYAGDPRLRARHHGAGQGDRRRHAAGGLRRPARHDGEAGAAGPGVPGRHAVRQPGGHRLRPGHLREIAQPGFYEALAKEDTRSLVDGLTAAAAGRRALCADCEGGMFGFFLLPQLPQNYAPVMKSDSPKFNRCSTACWIAACTSRRRCTKPAS
jgi:glutamate-1-semialdehyde 2,1-aminomutase